MMTALIYVKFQEGNKNVEQTYVLKYTNVKAHHLLHNITNQCLTVAFNKLVIICIK